MSTNRQSLDIRGQLTRIPAQWLIIAAAMLALVVMILLHTRGRASVSPLEVLLGTQPAPAREGMVVSQDGVTVYMPANATDLEGTLSIAVAAPGLSLVSDGTEWTLLKVVRIEFRSPNGMSLSNITFALPLQICFHLTEQQWQAYSAAPESYRVQQYNEQTSPPAWQMLPPLAYADQLQLCGQSTHLSLFGLAVHAPPVIPITGGMLPAQTRDEDEHVSAPPVRPTDRPADDVPPTPPPPLQPQPTNPPPAEEPRPGNQGPGNGNGNEGPGNGNGNGGGGNGNGNEGPGNGNGNGGGGNGNEGGGNGGEGNGNQGGGNGGEGNGNQGGGNGGEGNGNQGGGNGGEGNGNQGGGNGDGGRGKGP